MALVNVDEVTHFTNLPTELRNAILAFADADQKLSTLVTKMRNDGEISASTYNYIVIQYFKRPR